MAAYIKYGSYVFTRSATWKERMAKKIDFSTVSVIVNKDGTTINSPTKLDGRKITITGKLKDTTQSGLEVLEKDLRKAMFAGEVNQLWLWDDKYVNARTVSVDTEPISGSGVLAMDYSVEFYCDDPYIYTTSASHEDFAISGDTLTAVHNCLSYGKTYPTLKILATDVITSGFVIKKTDGESIAQITDDMDGAIIGKTNALTTAGQTFTPAKAGLLTSISTKLKRVGSPAGNVRILVKAFSGGVPTGDVLTSSEYISSMAVSLNGGVIKFNFDGTVALSAGTQYIYYYDYTFSLNVANYLLQRHKGTASSYAGGCAYQYASFTDTWVDVPDEDAYFSIILGSGEEDSIIINQALADGDELEIDTKEGTVELNGTSILADIDRGGDLDMFLTYGANNFSLEDMGAAGAGIFRVEYNMREY